MMKKEDDRPAQATQLSPITTNVIERKKLCKKSPTLVNNMDGTFQEHNALKCEEINMLW